MRDGGRSGAPEPELCAGEGMAAPGIGGAAGRAGNTRGAGNAGEPGTEAAGRAVPGIVIDDGATFGNGAPGACGLCGMGCCGTLGAAGMPTGACEAGAGIGCLGPDKICPGFGAAGAGGTGRGAMTGARFTIGGFNGALGDEDGCPVASGGRNGNAERRSATGGAATSTACAASAAGFSINAWGASRTAASGI